MSSKRLKIAVVLAVLLLGVVGVWYQYGRQQSTNSASNQSASPATYKLVLENSKAYVVGVPQNLSFKITDNKDQLLKDVEPVHGDRVHAVIVRKDRSQFQYLDAKYDESSATYNLSNLTLPNDGEYRLFVNFTPTNAPLGDSGVATTVTTYADLKAGDASKYQAQTVNAEQFKSSDNGFDINLFLAPHDPTDPGLIAKATSSFAVSVNKSDEPFRQLQLYKGTRGSIVLIGPNLEFVHIHSQNEEVPDTYVLSFSVDFPSSGYYRAFMQTKTNNLVNDTDYVLNVGELPDSSSPMPDMGGH